MRSQGRRSSVLELDTAVLELLDQAQKLDTPGIAAHVATVGRDTRSRTADVEARALGSTPRRDTPGVDPRARLRPPALRRLPDGRELPLLRLVPKHLARLDAEQPPAHLQAA